MSEIQVYKAPMLIPSEHEMAVFQVMAKQAVNSKMYKGIGDESGIMMIMLAARELGLPPVQSLNGGINIIQGKIEISARMMGALIRKAGHDFGVVEETPTKCTIEGVRCDTNRKERASFTLEEAQRAGLVKTGGGWTKWLGDMLYARALSRLSRRLFQDVIGIGYVEGEIKAIECEVEAINEPQIVEIAEDNDKIIAEALSKFEKEDPTHVEEYYEAVQKHFGWSRFETSKKFLEDENLLTKYQTWLEKNEKIRKK